MRKILIFGTAILSLFCRSNTAFSAPKVQPKANEECKDGENPLVVVIGDEKERYALLFCADPSKATDKDDPRSWSWTLRAVEALASPKDATEIEKF